MKQRLRKQRPTFWPRGVEDMERYPEDHNIKPDFVCITKIVVPTQRDKDELLKAIRYIHYLHELDTDYYAVNTLAHMYLAPDLIEVEHP